MLNAQIKSVILLFFVKILEQIKSHVFKEILVFTPAAIRFSQLVNLVFPSFDQGLCMVESCVLISICKPLLSRFLEPKNFLLFQNSVQLFVKLFFKLI